VAPRVSKTVSDIPSTATTEKTNLYSCTSTPRLSLRCATNLKITGIQYPKLLEHSTTEIQQRQKKVHVFTAAHTTMPLVSIFITNRIRSCCLFFLAADNFQPTAKTVAVFHWNYEKQTTATKQHTLSSLFPLPKRKSSFHRRIFHRRGFERRTTIITYIYYLCRR
jgi:hypothetical protein